MSNSDDAVCRGSFIFGSACGKCSRCKGKLEQIRDLAGLVLREDYDDLKLHADKLAEALEMYSMTNESFPEYGDVARQALAAYRARFPKDGE